MISSLIEVRNSTETKKLIFMKGMHWLPYYIIVLSSNNCQMMISNEEDFIRGRTTKIKTEKSATSATVSVSYTHLTLPTIYSV